MTANIVRPSDLPPLRGQNPDPPPHEWAWPPCHHIHSASTPYSCQLPTTSSDWRSALRPSALSVPPLLAAVATHPPPTAACSPSFVKTSLLSLLSVSAASCPTLQNPTQVSATQQVEVPVKLLWTSSILTVFAFHDIIFVSQAIRCGVHAPLSNIFLYLRWNVTRHVLGSAAYQPDAATSEYLAA